MGPQQMAPLNVPKYASPLEQPGRLSVEEHSRINMALWKERDKFMTKLQAKRAQRAYIENRSAALVQALYRGYSVRRGWAELASNLLLRIQLRQQLFTKILADSGYVRSAADHKENRRIAKLESATQIQSIMRQKSARGLYE